METPDTKPYNLPDNAVWFITGCSSGIGQGLAQYIATKKPTQRVVATARNPASLSDIPDGPNVLKLAPDVTSVPSIDAAFDTTLAHFGRVDIAVNNAGPDNAFYHASKFAPEGFAESIAKEVFPEWNIHVCGVEPGGVRTKYATTSSLQRMPTRHPAYDWPGGATSGMLAFMDNMIPIRVPLGRDSWGMVVAETERVRGELEE
ncbi:NAD(P)-binding protein [Daldinia loculata]|nr:NAD(P)-binding protein [Daldinia loculata]